MTMHILETEKGVIEMVYNMNVHVLDKDLEVVA